MTMTNNRERGSTLVVSLIFLLVFLIMALSVFRGSLTSSQAIGNMQWRNEAISAANVAIDQLLSESRIAAESLRITQEVNAAPLKYDVNGDGKSVILVSFPPVNVDGITRAGPRCLRVTPIPAEKLDPDKREDRACFGSSSSSGIAVDSAGGTSVVSGPQSLCANSDWSMTVRATDAATSTSVDVVQGYSVRILTTSAAVCD